MSDRENLSRNLSQDPLSAGDEQSSTKHPNFFIVGAAKAGTTSLWMYLKQHPEIFMHPYIELKEPAFFCHLRGFKDFATYLHLFADAKEEKAIGEASTAYLTSPESAVWIKTVYPDAKIIIILRNPVERAFSLYNWMVCEGHEWVHPFEKALVREKDRMNDFDFKYDNPVQYYYNYLYFHSGLYSEQVKRYIDIFPKEQIHIILTKELKREPVKTIQELYKFLGVNCNFVPEIKIHNKGKFPLSIKFQFFIRQKLLDYLNQFRIPSALRIWRYSFKTNIFFGKIRQITLAPETRSTLKQGYKDDILKTSDLIEKELDEWLK
ncbi:MAG: sulfotransferase [Cyanobacteriota bacterium]|nr:sulfotransferase [Cyanobacteriota bacterium]